MNGKLALINYLLFKLYVHLMAITRICMWFSKIIKTNTVRSCCIAFYQPNIKFL